jgi:hypothetical protein
MPKAVENHALNIMVEYSTNPKEPVFSDGSFACIVLGNPAVSFVLTMVTYMVPYK